MSPVSGGSLAAAYYGRYGSQPDRWAVPRVRELFRSDFEASWIFRWFLPQNIARYWFTDFDRSDIMKGVFDSVLFGGTTFAAMGGMESGPRIFLNSTDYTTWKRFTFADEAFTDIGSRLDTYPLSHAVMASGAFPGAFANVTLRNFRISPEKVYTHLLDGGPADNLGISTLLEVARGLYQKPAALRPSGCFFIIVDAYAATQYEELRVQLSRSGGDPSAAPGARERDTRKILDYFVDTNALAAANVLLYYSRASLLQESGIDPVRSWREPVREFPLFPDESISTVRCMAWHVTFERLLSTDFEGYGYGQLAAQVASLVNRIPTRYKLAAPEDARPEVLQNALFDAARLLIKEDRDAADRACQWFRAHGLAELPGCLV